uniref:Uncharacterized protein n=1 Tax=Cannabis sativa TaxID=3483 RepID=A0A803PU95_CANSA
MVNTRKNTSKKVPLDTIMEDADSHTSDLQASGIREEGTVHAKNQGEDTENVFDDLDDGQNLKGGDEEEKAHHENEEDDGESAEPPQKDTIAPVNPQGHRRPPMLLSPDALLTLKAKSRHEDKVQWHPHIKGKGITPATRLTKVVEPPWDSPGTVRGIFVPS